MAGKRCPEKIEYSSILDALDVLIDAAKKARRQGTYPVVIRLYKCIYCAGGWHTTSQPRKDLRKQVEQATARKILGITRPHPKGLT